MHRTKRGNQWHFGMKAHIVEDAEWGLLHTVVGSAANVNDMHEGRKLAIEAGAPRVFRINQADELPDDLHGTVGVTAGASAPEELVAAVIAKLAPRDGVEHLRVTDEDEYFPPPRNIRELQAAIGVASGVLLGADAAASSTFDDHRLAASDVLAYLAD